MYAFCYTCNSDRRATEDDAECWQCGNQLMISGSEVGTYYVSDEIWQSFQSFKCEVDTLAIEYLKTKFPGGKFVVGKPLHEVQLQRWMCRIVYDRERVFFHEMFPDFDDPLVLQVIMHKSGTSEPFKFTYEIREFVKPREVTRGGE